MRPLALLADEAQKLDGAGAGGPEPVGRTGVELLGALLSAGYRDAFDGRLGAVPVPEGVADTAREGIANAVEAADKAGGPHTEALVGAAQESFVAGWQQAMWAGVAVMALLFIHVLVRGPRRPAATSTPASTPTPALTPTPEPEPETERAGG